MGVAKRSDCTPSPRPPASASPADLLFGAIKCWFVSIKVHLGRTTLEPHASQVDFDRTKHMFFAPGSSSAQNGPNGPETAPGKPQEAILGPSWGHLGAVLGPSWGHLGAIVGASWSHTGPSWRHLGAILGRLGAISRPQEPIGGEKARRRKTLIFIMCLKDLGLLGGSLEASEGT